MKDLFEKLPAQRTDYTAHDIEVLEGLEPVRRRPGMYIGGTDERALHHLVAEVLDNAMDEAVAGHASKIEILLEDNNQVVIRDNGRGIPTDPHPKIKGKSALEVILTTLHSGGKFGGNAYSTSGGLHGVGLSVVNALSDHLSVEVVRDGNWFQQNYSRGIPVSKLKSSPAGNQKRGTLIRFHPDPAIFDDAKLRPARLYRMARSKAYLFRGVEISWTCSDNLLKSEEGVPSKEKLHFPGGLLDYLRAQLEKQATVTASPFFGQAALPEGQGRVEWAIGWPASGEGFFHSYCNTIPTVEGGTHETGLRTGLTRSLKAYGELINNKKIASVTADDLLGDAAILLSVFIREPQFQGQTKEKLTSAEAVRLVEAVTKDHFDHWLSEDPARARDFIEYVLSRYEERVAKRQDKELQRKTATRKLRLPGKLTDCARDSAEGTEIFLVEGDSAGGSAKQARLREIQAVLPLRGKILNVASASTDKLKSNQELSDLIQALGCGTRDHYDDSKLRYERVIIMTDADVDGAHIASLLMTFFYQEMRGLIERGHLFLAMPPLYRLSQGGDTVYARDDAHKEALLKSHFKGRGKIDISRFKGLGEMPATQLKETTMDPQKRSLLKVTLPERYGAEDERGAARMTADLVESLMGRKADARFAFIQENARFIQDLDI